MGKPNKAVSQTPAENKSENDTNTPHPAANLDDPGAPKTSEPSKNDDTPEVKNPPVPPAPPEAPKQEALAGASNQSAESSSADEDEPIVKSNFEHLNVRAVCPNGDPFTGTYGTVNFGGEGYAVVSRSDAQSLEDLIEQFPGIEIKPVE